MPWVVKNNSSNNLLFVLQFIFITSRKSEARHSSSESGPASATNIWRLQCGLYACTRLLVLQNAQLAIKRRESITS